MVYSEYALCMTLPAPFVQPLPSSFVLHGFVRIASVVPDYIPLVPPLRFIQCFWRSPTFSVLESQLQLWLLDYMVEAPTQTFQSIVYVTCVEAASKKSIWIAERLACQERWALWGEMDLDEDECSHLCQNEHKELLHLPRHSREMRLHSVSQVMKTGSAGTLLLQI